MTTGDEPKSQTGKEAFEANHTPCLLALEDGSTFSGYAFGATGTKTGEIVFNTSLCGYQEILTDPSYAGQVVTMTYPEIGNYGTNEEDLESNGGKVYARGLIVRHISRIHSSWRANSSLNDFLRKHNVVGITDVDTRAITRRIREKGAMRCAISTEVLEPEQLVKIAADSPLMTGADFSKEVTTDEIFKMGNGKYKIAVLDYGIKMNILRQLAKRDFSLTVYPAHTPADTILKENPHGVFLSNGPGDPAACEPMIDELKKIIDTRIPIFGICLGHQLLSLAFGAKTYKLKFGHRGGNQPVKDLLTGKIEITSQNHGFAVDGETLPEDLELTHVNLNDNSVEGFRHKKLPVFAVQYHPEASPGPHDADYLFERFYELVDTNSRVVV